MCSANNQSHDPEEEVEEKVKELEFRFEGFYDSMLNRLSVMNRMMARCVGVNTRKTDRHESLNIEKDQ